MRRDRYLVGRSAVVDCHRRDVDDVATIRAGLEDVQSVNLMSEGFETKIGTTRLFDPGTERKIVLDR